MKLTKEVLAEKLEGVQYPLTITSELREVIADSNLVIVYGASDDLIEFDGSIYEEMSAWEGATVYVLTDGSVIKDYNYEERIALASGNELEELKKAQKIQAIWGEEGISFQYKTKIPHAVFNVLEDKDIYCKGIVFDMNVMRQLHLIEKVEKF